MKLDGSLFAWYDKSGNLIGLMGSFVDDVLWAGSDLFNSVIKQLKRVFKIGTENSQHFNYVGLTLTQEGDNVIIKQDDYTSTIEKIEVTTSDKSNRNRTLIAEEVRKLRSTLGQLNWLACTSRPEISFAVSDLSSKVKSATVNELIEVNKVVKFIKTTPSLLKIPKLDLESTRVASYTDASFNSMIDGSSQGAFIIFLYDKNGSCAPISWASNRIKRVVRSSLAAETLAFMEGADSAHFVSKLLEEVLTKCVINVDSFTDSKSLFDVVGTSSLTTDKRLRVEISAIREMVDNNELTINWLKKELQVSDCLTKKGASTALLLETLQTAKLP